MKNEDERAIQAVLDGDTESFGVLIRKYQTPVYNLMLRTTGCVEDATDLTQEVFLRAFRKLDTFLADKSFFTWIYTIGVNLARDSLRKKKRRQRWFQSEGDLPFPPVEAKMGADARLDTRRAELLSLYQGLLALSLDYREALILRYREGLNMKELAEVLQISESGAKMRVHRGLQQLKAKLKDKGEADER